MKSPMISFRCTPIDLAAVKAFLKAMNHERRKRKMKPASLSAFIVVALRKATSLDPAHYGHHPMTEPTAPAAASAKVAGSRRRGQTSTR